MIEEPEIHLHPVLQKRLLKYFESTSNQYIIASHSSAFFDLEGVRLYHCWLEGKHSKLRPASTDNERCRVLADLGYRPSDLLQANFVLWVEGPSDRIYIRHWMKLLTSNEFVEGLHYSIMFYGGRLLSHLSHSGREVGDFIQLCRLAQHCGIVVDSDRKDDHGKLGETKRRVLKEFREQGDRKSVV